MSLLVADDFIPPQPPPPPGPLEVTLGAYTERDLGTETVAEWVLPAIGYNVFESLYKVFTPTVRVVSTVEVRCFVDFADPAVAEWTVIQVLGPTSPWGHLPLGSIRFNMPTQQLATGTNNPDTVQVNADRYGGSEYFIPGLKPSEIFADGGFHVLSLDVTNDPAGSYQLVPTIDGVTYPIIARPFQFAGPPEYVRNGHRLHRPGPGPVSIQYRRVEVTDGA